MSTPDLALDETTVTAVRSHLPRVAKLVVAEVMDRQENVEITELPSMIRVDCVGRMDFVYADISEALGEDPDFYNAAEFEENMSSFDQLEIQLETFVENLLFD